MSDWILVKDRWGSERIINLLHIAAVYLDDERRMDGVIYPAVTITAIAPSGSEDFSSSGMEITITGEQAVALRAYLLQRVTCSFTQFPTAEDVHIEPESKMAEIDDEEDPF